MAGGHPIYGELIDNTHPVFTGNGHAPILGGMGDEYQGALSGESLGAKGLHIGDGMHPGMKTFHGPDVTIPTDPAGVHVEQSSGENSYINNSTGEMSDLSGKLNQSSSAASTSPEFVDTRTGQSVSGVNRSTNSQARGGGRKSPFSAVKEQSLVPNDGGSATPIGNTSMGTTMQNIAASGQSAVAKAGTFDQMSEVAGAASGAGIPVSPAIQKGVAQGEEFKKKNNYAPGNIKGR